MTAGIGGIEQVDGLIAIMQAIQEAGPEFARAGGDAALAWNRAELAAGRDPNTGQAWAPTQAGTPPLRNAPAALSVRMVGTTALLVLSGHHIFHHFKTGYNPERRQIPQGRLPKRMGEAIRLGLIPPFEAKTARGKMGTAKYEARRGRAA